MWTIKERIACFLVITVLVVILFTPAQGYCVVLKGNLVKTGVSQTPLSDVRIFLYDWDLVKQQGLVPIGPIAKTGTTVEGRNFEVDLKDTVSLNKEYLLLFSTQEIATIESYPSFFYGAYNEADYSNPSKFSKQPKWDLINVPKIRFTSGTFDLGTFNPPDTGDGKGVWLFGFIKDETGKLKKEVGVEIYGDQNGIPVLLPYPFYRLVKTDEPDSLGRNFKIGGLLKNTKYYIKLIANHLGYIDTFYTGQDPNVPTQFILTGNYVTDEFRLTRKGARIWGYLKDKENNNPITKSVISIQAVSYTDDQQVQFMQNYVHDPNYLRFDMLSDADKHFFGYDRFNYNSNGLYEMKGLPFEDHDYFLVATELPGETPKKFATPLFYDGNDGVFNINQAKTISLPGAGTSYRVDFILDKGACIEGDVDMDPNGQMSDHVKSVLRFTDPDVFDKLPLYIDAYQVSKSGSLLLMGQSMIEGFGHFALCGLPPGDYIIKAYDPVFMFYTGEFWDNQTTYITAEKITLDFGGKDQGNDMDLALGGIIEGRVVDSIGEPVSNAAVFVNQINAGNPLVGYYFVNSEGAILAQHPTQTDPNGKFYAWGLPAGFYTIFVNGILVDKDIGYLPQFYDPNNLNTSMTANQTPPIFITENNPDFVTLETFHLKQIGAESGGIISGNISLDPGISSLVTLSVNSFLMRLFNAKTGIEVSNPLYRFYDPNSTGGNILPYSIMVPTDGDYILSVQDLKGTLLPHYYSSQQSTVNIDEAEALVIDQDHISLKGIDFVFRKKAGEISGQAIDPDGKEISGLYVYASQQIMEGPDKGTWKNVRQATTNANGAFTLKGLFPGTYIFSIYDPLFRYAPIYYHPSQALYTHEGADQWSYDPDSSSSPPSIVFNLKKGGRIQGKVGNDFIGTKIYVYLMKEGRQVAGYSTNADPNFLVPGLPPGKYMLGYQDPNLNYLPVYYIKSGFTTDPDQINPNDITIEEKDPPKLVDVGEMSFTQLVAEAAEVKGQVLKTETDGNLAPMPYTYIFLYYKSENKEIWATTPARFSATDSYGNYSLKGLSKGNYKIIAFGPQYRPISRTLTIEESDLGSVIQVEDLIFPSGWLDNLDKTGSNKYNRTLELEKGLNLVAYPTRIPPYITGYNSLSFLKDIVIVNGHGGMSLRTFSTHDQKWKSASFGNAVSEGTQITGVHGSNFYLSNGQGFMLYSQEGPTINFLYFPGQTALWLKKGINVVGNVAFNKELADVIDPNLISDTNFTTRKMLAQMGEDASISIQTLNAKAGKWQATYWMWGKPAGTEVKVEDEQGYLVSMKKDLNDWYPTNNN